MLIQSNYRHPAAVAANMHFQVDETPTLIAQARPCAVSFYADGSAIYGQGQEAGPLYLVEFGAVRICRLTADGRRQISAFYFAGEVFGFESAGEHHFFAESIGGAGIRVLRMAHGEHTADAMLSLALHGLTRAQQHMLVLGRQNAVEKLAAFLVDLTQRQESEKLINLAMPRVDIADYLGVTLETVSRVFGKLKTSRIIRMNSAKQIEILDIDALTDLAD